MNPDNYGSREACERLFKAGIVLETEKRWYKGPGYVRLYDADIKSNLPSVSAPSMAEVLREFKNLTGNDLIEILERIDPDIGRDGQPMVLNVIYKMVELCKNIDALIDLRIWMGKEGT